MNKFIELVREMRNAQKEYFKTRDKSVLLKSKELERKVDSFLTQQVINQQTQQTTTLPALTPLTALP